MKTKRRWGEWVPPGWVPDESMAFFGANPCHSRAMEESRPETCLRCGGLDVGSRDDPIRVYSVHVGSVGIPKGKLARNAFRADAVVVVCGHCRRAPAPIEARLAAERTRTEAAEMEWFAKKQLEQQKAIEAQRLKRPKRDKAAKCPGHK